MIKESELIAMIVEYDSSMRESMKQRDEYKANKQHAKAKEEDLHVAHLCHIIGLLRSIKDMHKGEKESEKECPDCGMVY